MKFSRLLFFCVSAILVFSGTASAKTLLEKSIYFVNPENGKIDSAKYWTLFIGTYPALTLVRKFPGEDSLKVTSDVDLTVLSSGYIEGYGYTGKGRVDCMAMFVIDTGSGPIRLPLDSIEYICAGGAKVKPRGMKVCDAAIDVEGNRVPAIRKMLLTRYNLVVDEDERTLKPLGDMDIELFAFSKAALAEARKTENEPAAAPVKAK